jgi:hypothetical protein
MIERPTTSYVDPKRKTSILKFADGRQCEVDLRGGICLPISVPRRQNQTVGYAVLGGYDVKTGIISIYEAQEFMTVDPFVRDGKIIHDGLAGFFGLAWSVYGTKTFYLNQKREMVKKFRLDVVRSKMIQPHPCLIELGFEEETTRNKFLEYLTLTKVLISEDSELVEALQQFQSDPMIEMPEVKALAYCCAGFDKFSWREPVKEPDNIPIVHFHGSLPRRKK